MLADGVSEPTATLTAVSVPPATTLNGADATAAGSDVVETETVLPAPAGPLVTPANVIVTGVPGAIERPEKSAHWTVSSIGFEQLPTSTPPALTVAPAQPAKLVPVGKLTSMRLLASCDSPPVAEVVKRTT